jgi:hypothetical protein
MTSPTTAASLGLIPCRDAQELKAAFDPATDLGQRFGTALISALADHDLLSDDEQRVAACSLQELGVAVSDALSRAVLLTSHTGAWADPACEWITDACLAATQEASK